MHSSKFDVTTGKKLSDPVLEMGGPGGMLTGCPDNVKKAMTQMFQGIAGNQRLIRTCDQTVYEVKADGNDLLVNLEGTK